MLRSKKFAAGFTGVGGVVGDQKFIGVAEQVNAVVCKIAKIQTGYAAQHGGQARVLFLDRGAKAVAGGVKISKQPLDILLRRIAEGGAFNGGKDGGQIGVQALIGLGVGDHIGKQLAGIDEVALGFDGIVPDFRSDDSVVQRGVVDACVASFHVADKMLADKTVKQSPKHILFEVPAVHSATDIIGYFPDLALQGIALLGAGHMLQSILLYPFCGVFCHPQS